MKNNKPTRHRKASTYSICSANAIDVAPAYLGEFVILVRRGLLELRPSPHAAKLGQIANDVEALIGPVEKIVRAASGRDDIYV
jgi:hypothetical protein